MTLFDTRASTPVDEYGTVPTVAERSGDFSGLTLYGHPVTIYDPTTGQPFPNNTITTGISPQAQALLSFIPLPNVTGNAEQNYHRLATQGNNSTTLGVRLIHSFGQGGGSPFASMVKTVYWRQYHRLQPEHQWQLQLQPYRLGYHQSLSGAERQEPDAAILSRRGIFAWPWKAE